MAYPLGAGTIEVFPTTLNLNKQTSAFDGFDNLTTLQFLKLTPKDLHSRTGKRVTLKERIVLKLVQKRAKKSLTQGMRFNLAEAKATADGNFNLGGFLLGFFFSLIGVLIAILFGRNAVRSALIGALCGLLVAAIAVLV